eukprot:6183838-Pleurochrysis_carterae.AAC.5
MQIAESRREDRDLVLVVRTQDSCEKLHLWLGEAERGESVQPCGADAISRESERGVETSTGAHTQE